MDDAPDGPVGARLAPAELGARLTALREAAGSTVEQVAARTRIRASLIRSMEAGDFAPCGGAVYARGHLRSIAHVLATDGGRLVAAYDQMAGQPSPSASTVALDPLDPPRSEVPFAAMTDRPLPTPVQVTGSLETHDGRLSPSMGPMLVLPGRDSALRERRGSPWLLAAAGVTAAVVVVAGIALVGGGSHPAGTQQSAGTAVAQGSPAPGSRPAAPPASPTAPTTLALAGVNVTVTIATGSSWVHVVDGTGALVFQGVLGPGTSKAFHSAQQLRFVFGFAPAVHLVVNGHDLGSPPATGGSDVADAVFDTTSGG